MTIKPEDVRADLAAKASGGAARDGAGPAGTAAAAAKEESVLESISASYFMLRRGMAFIALAFPIALWLGGGIDHLQASISAYYHFDATGGPASAYGAGKMRDVFVGVLWAIGGFLFFYKGYSRKEDMALNVAGIAAILVSLFPMDWPGEAGSVTNTVHFASAVVYFLAIAYVCLFRSGDTLRLMRDEARRRRFKRVYGLLGTLMVALPLSVFLLHLLADRFRLLAEGADETRVVLAIEVAAIWVFAIFWLVKSREIAILEKQ